MRSKGYDLVLNGSELGSGSIRIHQQELQARVFKALGLSPEQQRARFGFFLDALTYGTPPHGGIALGLDRVVALLAREKSIREVIAFPKTAKAQDLMAEAPSGIEQPQEEELELMGAWPNLPAKHWELANFCDRLIRLLERDLLKKKENLACETDFQTAMAFIVANSRDDARSAVRLAKAGYGPEAAGLCRSLVEAAINSEYIAQAPTERASQYLRTVPEFNSVLIKKLKRHAQSADALHAARIPDDTSEVASGWPKSLAERAHAVQKPSYAYDVVFSMLSQQVHASASAMTPDVKLLGPDCLAVRYGRGPDWVDTALATVFLFLGPAMNVAYDAFSIPKSSIESLFEEFRKLHEV
jgi:hypothetical protein